MPEQTAPTRRPYTPIRDNPDGSRTITVHRMCSGCGRDLGDVTMEEIQDAIDGKPLSGTRAECGCGGTSRDASAVADD
ncbi:hypothetical protein [Nocardia gipuzkoensis]|uniref:hypothetical protein n=1 Tax=Nocardia gipuzkoensis TaxID=2749991 RepID=UPI00237D85C9|nr:hypothetical protein [Nocardia gipuzkoensis]MDE1673804.1 hypothetical protein [Nocardia gipuzkoensis]